MKRPSWDDLFMEVAEVFSKRSQDARTKVGAVITGPDHDVRGIGYNGFPRGTRTLDTRDKYLWTEHAERNVIYSAARRGESTEGCTLYTNVFPCMDCSRAIVQSGIRKVITSARRYSRRYGSQYEEVLELFGEAGVEVEFYE